MRDLLKMITLDEAACGRLKAWKKGSSESFSSLVKRVLSSPGSLGAFLAFVEWRATAVKPGNVAMEAAVEARSAAQPDPWT